MFDLEKALAAWRRSLRYRRAFFDEDLEELERHLRDHTHWLVEQGYAEKEAFARALKSVGDYAAVEAEYRKVFWAKVKHKRRLLRALAGEVAMLSNYVKVALRNLKKHKGYTLINVGGLAVGITCCLLIFLYVQDELRFDRFHAQADRIHRVVLESGDAEASALNMFFVADRLREEYPEIRQAVRLFRHWEKPLITRDEQGFIEEQFFFADSSFFDVFTFPLLRGDPVTALEAPFSVVLTASAARKYFGDDDPVGQTLRYNAKQDVRVTGVMRDVPHTSHFRPDFVASMSTLHQVSYRRIREEWRVFYTYVVLEGGVPAAEVAQKAADFYRRHYGPDSPARLQLQSLTDIHFRSQIANELEANSDIRYLYLLWAIGFIIVLIASINYMNLATARSANRAREVGMRKMAGAHRLQIIRQFFGESLLLSVLAFLLSVGVAWTLLPVLNQLTGKALSFSSGVYGLLVGGGALAVTVGLAAGAYPAVFLSRFHPAEVLKGRFKAGRHGRLLRQSLVVIQFAASVVLMVGTLVIFQQLSYIRATSLGFEEAHVLAVSVQDPEVRQQYGALREEWLRDAGVVAVGATSSSYPGKNASYGHVVRQEGASEEEAVTMYRNWVDAHFIDALGIERLAGRDFAVSTDAEGGAVLLNEAAVKALGWGSPEEALGQRVVVNGTFGETVIGVVKDFHFRSLHHQIEPLFLTPQFHTPTNLLVRIQTADVPQALAGLQATWEDVAASQPFTYSFLDDTVAALYRADAWWGRVIGYAALIALVIACLGLFGLAAFSAEQRTKEVGVRKALGASVGSIVALLARDFLKLVAIAFIAGAPLAYAVAHRWLDSFAYRIDLSWRIFLIAGLAALGIAVLTVSYQAIKAAVADPVKALRYE